MEFEDYKRDVSKSFNKWSDLLFSRRMAEAEVAKEETSDLIYSWKAIHPKKEDEINSYVSILYQKRFS